LLQVRDAAKRGVARIFGRHTRSDSLFNLSLQVIAQFFIEILLDAIAPK
jgi:hypothetical protein